jgi:hypothetical protein
MSKIQPLSGQFLFSFLNNMVIKHSFHVVMDGSCGVLQPKYGGKIIDIVSRDVRHPEDKAQALEDVKGTIFENH